MSTLQARFKQARINKGLSQAQLAKIVGVSQTGVFYIESGQVKSSGIKLLDRFCQVLEVSKEWLLLGMQLDDFCSIPILTKVFLLKSSITSVNNRDGIRMHKIYLKGNSKKNLFAYELDGLDQAMLCDAFKITDLLIFDADFVPRSGYYVLVRDYKLNEILFRRFVEDLGEKYLHPVNQHFSPIKLCSDHKILGTLITKQSFYTNNIVSL